MKAIFQLKKRDAARLLLLELLPFAVALLATDTFLKLGSFAAEGVVFTALWRGQHFLLGKMTGGRRNG